ncbi:hypothetical protein FJ955_03055 [Mesorhizobium sp. B2-2-2]|uniref:phage adaptor protein n=1 Tax=Mesorhizobium sp. B2-2-2 TaxID=2589964 RepID=UPI001128A7DC|nr:hypothetical protein [Mesorhizobium sp. B2-2-2]TPM33733.1 hypothetical protein FJ955_03055 [Mesorhizobium sp. B2-2-2]
MTVLSVVQDACLAVGETRPLALFSATDRKWQEFQALANEAAKVIAKAYDWQKLRKVATLTGDGTAEDFNLPTDYGRMLKKGSLWTSRWRWDMSHIVNSDEWLGMEVYPVTLVQGAWTLYGNQIHIRPLMGSAETAKFFYITSQIVSPSKTAFSADEDVFVLDERVLKLATIYLWKQSKGQDFAAELADYEIAVGQAYDDDGGSKPVVSGNSGSNWRRNNVWPGTVGPA